MHPNDAPAPAGAGPMAIVALVTGVLGILMSLFGCLFSPFLLVGGLLSLVAIVLGFVELRSISAGASSEDGRPMALVGVGLGGGGCLMGGCTVTATVGFIVVYFAFLCMALAAGGLQ